MSAVAFLLSSWLGARDLAQEAGVLAVQLSSGVSVRRA
jgi:hypothetical protein